MDTLPNELIKKILKYCADYILTIRCVCVKWAAWLQPGGEILTPEYIESCYFIAFLPTTCYEFFTFEQKVLLPNSYCIKSFDTFCPLKKGFAVSWPEIMKYILENLRAVFHMFFDMVASEALWTMSKNNRYFKYLFENYEQYRRHILPRLPPEVTKAIITLYGRRDVSQIQSVIRKITDDIWTFISMARHEVNKEITAERKHLHKQYKSVVKARVIVIT